MMDEKLFSSAYTVRKLNADDIDRIYELCARNTLYYEYCPPAVSKAGIEEDMAALPSGMSAENKYYVGYFRDGALIAVLDIIDGYPETGKTFIGFFMTDTGIQNRGIGTDIIGELTCYLQASGYLAVQLAWVEENPQAEHFWLKNGFTPVKKTSSPVAESVILAERILTGPLSVNGKEYRVIRLLGKGKGGYSYLVSDGNGLFVLKQIHHEPCSYYQFGDKLQSELNDYNRLRSIGIRMPELLDCDTARERILKEYIAGDTIAELVKADKDVSVYISQVKDMCGLLYAAGTNIDYFPTNFIARDGVLFYIDYECNSYMEEWNFENWGIKYWSKTKEFIEHFST